MFCEWFIFTSLLLRMTFKFLHLPVAFASNLDIIREVLILSSSLVKTFNKMPDCRLILTKVSSCLRMLLHGCPVKLEVIPFETSR